MSYYWDLKMHLCKNTNIELAIPYNVTMDML